MESNKNLMNEEFTNFIHDIIDKDLEEGVCKSSYTFPSEPNGYLHIDMLKQFGLILVLQKIWRL